MFDKRENWELINEAVQEFWQVRITAGSNTALNDFNHLTQIKEAQRIREEAMIVIAKCNEVIERATNDWNKPIKMTRLNTPTEKE